jgi:hypothetical protein
VCGRAVGKEARVDPSVVLLIIVVVSLIIGARMFAGSLDHDRIRADIEKSGGRVESIEWTPFARGWFGREKERSYSVRYTDAEGEPRRVTCSTSMLAGVFYRDDEPAGPDRRETTVPEDGADPDGGAAEMADALLEENARLRAEIERLRGRA